jgi:hypothetical protein
MDVNKLNGIEITQNESDGKWNEMEVNVAILKEFLEQDTPTSFQTF